MFGQGNGKLICMLTTRVMTIISVECLCSFFLHLNLHLLPFTNTRIFAYLRNWKIEQNHRIIRPIPSHFVELFSLVDEWVLVEFWSNFFFHYSSWQYGTNFLNRNFSCHRCFDVFDLEKYSELRQVYLFIQKLCTENFESSSISICWAMVFLYFLSVRLFLWSNDLNHLYFPWELAMTKLKEFLTPISPFLHYFS